MNVNNFFLRCLFFIPFTFLGASKKPFTLSLKGGIGPSWHQLFVHEHFNLSSRATDVPLEDMVYPDSENIFTEFNAMPFGQTGLTLQTSQFYADFNIGGGLTKTGTGAIRYTVTQESFDGEVGPVEYITFAKLGVNVLITDASIGYIAKSKKHPVEALIKIGYTHNNENVGFCPPDKAAYWKIRNTWAGPHLGIKGSLILKKWSLAAWYTAVFGSVKTFFSLNASPAFFTDIENLTILPLEYAPTYWKSPILGSLFGLTIDYKISNTGTIGTTVNYMAYYTRKNSPIHFSLPQPLVTNACIRQQFWQQIILTLWGQLEY